jgi:oligosaccharide repeat unit polymerase
VYDGMGWRGEVIFVDLMIFFLLGLLACLSFYFARLLYNDIFGPVGLFFGMNLASLSLYSLKLIEMTSVSKNAYALIFVSLFCFGVGALLFSPRSVYKGAQVFKGALFQDDKKEGNGLAIFYYGTAILSIGGWISLLFLSDYTLGEILLSPDVLQYSFQKQYVGYLNLLGILVLPSFILLSLARGRVRIISMLFLLGALIGLLLAGIKSYFVFSLVISVFAWSAARPGKIGLKYFAIIALFIIVFMAFYDQYIDIFVTKQFEDSKFPAYLSFLERPYLYVVGAWPAMSEIIKNGLEQEHWAFLSLHFLWKILGSGLGLIPEVSNSEPFLDIGPTTFNVYSLIGGLYWDFGILGSIVGCFFLGAISTYLYIKARFSHNWVLYLGSGVFNYGLFLSFFLYYYRFNLIFLLLYVLLFGFLSRKLSFFLKAMVDLWYRKK